EVGAGIQLAKRLVPRGQGAACRLPHETHRGAPRQAKSLAGSLRLPRPAPRPLRGRLSGRGFWHRSPACLWPRRGLLEERPAVHAEGPGQVHGRDRRVKQHADGGEGLDREQIVRGSLLPAGRTFQFLGPSISFVRLGNPPQHSQGFAKVSEGGRRLRVEYDRPTVASDGLVQLSRVPTSHSQPAVRFGEPGVQLDRLAVAGDGFIAVQGIAEVEVGGNVLRVEPDRLPVAGDGLGPLVLPDQRQAEIGVSMRIFRVEADGLTAASLGLAEFALPPERDAKAVEGRGVRRVEPQGFPETGDGFRQFAFREQGVAEVMVRLVGLRMESDGVAQLGNGLVQFLRLSGLPGRAAAIGRQQETQPNDNGRTKKRLLPHDSLPFLKNSYCKDSTPLCRKVAFGRYRRREQVRSGAAIRSACLVYRRREPPGRNLSGRSINAGLRSRPPLQG